MWGDVGKIERRDKVELGNAIFGNSRGKCRVPRTKKWLFQLRRLVYELEEDGNLRFIPEFENDTFWLFPYYWGECTCGWGYIDDGHKTLKNQDHRYDCFQSELRKMEKYYERQFGFKFDLPENWKGRNVKKEFKRKRIELLDKHDIDYKEEEPFCGIYMKCNCDFYDRRKEILEEYAEKFGNEGHEFKCKVRKPNFYYKPNNFQIQWYKYPFRDSYMNKKITVKEFSKIINKCIDSLE